MSTPLPTIPAAPRLVRAEHVVMATTVLALVVLVVLPLAFLVAGSVTADGGLTLAHFRDALSSRLYVQALRNYWTNYYRLRRVTLYDFFGKAELR